MIPFASISYLRSAIINFDSVAETPEVLPGLWLRVDKGTQRVPRRIN